MDKKEEKAMTIPVSIQTLLQDHVVESNRIEFKENFNPVPIIKTICGFANDIDNIGGGYIVIGVKEKNGTPVLPPEGLDPQQIDSILKKILNLCHQIEPHYFPVAEPVVYEGKNLVLIQVKGGPGRPYRCPDNVTSKHSVLNYYIRKFSSTIKAEQSQLKQLYCVSETIPFDDRPNFFASVDDLDKDLMRAHLKEINSRLYELADEKTVTELARDLQLVSGPSEDEHPLNVGLLMFSRHIHDYFRYARIEIVDIPDPTGTNMVEKIFEGPIQTQLKDALLYLKNYAIKEKIIKSASQAKATRVFNYPFQALEEILANAVYHRSYQIHEPITVRITPTEIEITSHPGFDTSIQDKDIEKYEIRSRVYRNRRIGDFLKELHLIEGRNTGFPNAINALRKNGSPLFTIHSEPERSFLSIRLPIHPEFMRQNGKIEKEQAYIEQILSLIQKDPLTLTELAKSMGYKGISAKLRKTVQQLIAQGRLAYVVQGKNIKLTMKNDSTN